MNVLLLIPLCLYVCAVLIVRKRPLPSWCSVMQQCKRLIGTVVPFSLFFSLLETEATKLSLFLGDISL